MFGHYFRSIDEKNRVIIPSKLRKEFGNICYITIGLDNILELRNESAFSEWSGKLVSLNTLDAQVRKFARILLGRTFKIELDKQGRISILPEITSNIKLTKEVAFVGVGNRVEIHSKAKFIEVQQEFEEAGSLEELANKLLEKGQEL